MSAASDNIIPFEKAEPEKPKLRWAEGKAKCVGCKHEWGATAPVGATNLECPECGGMKGTWYYPFRADGDDYFFYCLKCDSDAMTAFKRNGHFFVMCMGCGWDHTEALFG